MKGVDSEDRYLASLMGMMASSIDSLVLYSIPLAMTVVTLLLLELPEMRLAARPSLRWASRRLIRSRFLGQKCQGRLIVLRGHSWQLLGIVSEHL